MPNCYYQSAFLVALLPALAGASRLKAQDRLQAQDASSDETMPALEHVGPSQLKYGSWECHDFADGQDEEWCQQQGEQNVDGYQYKFAGAAGEPCGSCWCCKRQVIAQPGPKPKVLFVLGGPGAGKGTQCYNIVEYFTDWAHISAGDCLRAERDDPNSSDGALINKHIKAGQIVPVEITIKLLMKEMQAKKEWGKTSFLIDGFPRSSDNVRGWEENVGDTVDLRGVLFFDVDKEELVRRLLGRGENSGRLDDNIESIQKRLVTYNQTTTPIVEKYRKEGKLFEFDASPRPEQVWEVVKAKMQEVDDA